MCIRDSHLPAKIVPRNLSARHRGTLPDSQRWRTIRPGGCGGFQRGLTDESRQVGTHFRQRKTCLAQCPEYQKYLDYLEDTFIINHAKRYDVKGRKHIGSPLKYYFEDVGLRNARLNFRQQEPTHLMENTIYNELIARGFSVDIGIVEQREKGARKQIEIDFIANQGSKRYYSVSYTHLTLPTICSV